MIVVLLSYASTHTHARRRGLSRTGTQKARGLHAAVVWWRTGSLREDTRRALRTWGGGGGGGGLRVDVDGLEEGDEGWRDVPRLQLVLRVGGIVGGVIDSENMPVLLSRSRAALALEPLCTLKSRSHSAHIRSFQP